MNPLLSIFDLLLVPFYIMGTYPHMYYVTKKNIRTNTVFNYFTRGLMVQVYGSIYFWLIN